VEFRPIFSIAGHPEALCNSSVIPDFGVYELPVREDETALLDWGIVIGGKSSTAL
jgi:hypothetical protein